MQTVLLTGFPGFLGSALLPRILPGEGSLRATCLVQERWIDEARRRRSLLVDTHPALEGRIELVSGDITLPGLGLRDPDALARRTAAVHHLAALYDVTADPERLRRVNVVGTRNVLEFAEACPDLERLHYVSTCYVSGRHPGVFRGADLAEHGPFNNAYEETKHGAEVEVRARMEAGLPATVYRPAIVVGDSRSGRTQKYDGPYYVIRFLVRQPRIAVMPVVGDPHRTRVNVVPRDFVVDAIAHLAGLEDSRGRTYQLADPSPLSVAEMLDEVEGALEKRVLRVRLPHGLARWALDAVPGLERRIGIPPEALDYFTHPTRYDPSAAMAALEGTGIRPPSFDDYVERLVAFVRTHPEPATGPMA